MTDPQQVDDAAATCEHWWISRHQPDFPAGLYYVEICGSCGSINGTALAESVRVREQAARREALEEAARLLDSLETNPDVVTDFEWTPEAKRTVRACAFLVSLLNPARAAGVGQEQGPVTEQGAWETTGVTACCGATVGTRHNLSCETVSVEQFHSELRGAKRSPAPEQGEPDGCTSCGLYPCNGSRFGCDVSDNSARITEGVVDV